MRKWNTWLFCLLVFPQSIVLNCRGYLSSVFEWWRCWCSTAFSRHGNHTNTHPKWPWPLNSNANIIWQTWSKQHGKVDEMTRKLIATNLPVETYEEPSSIVLWPYIALFTGPISTYDHWSEVFLSWSYVIKEVLVSYKIIEYQIINKKRGIWILIVHVLSCTQ